MLFSSACLEMLLLLEALFESLTLSLQRPIKSPVAPPPWPWMKTVCVNPSQKRSCWVLEVHRSAVNSLLGFTMLMFALFCLPCFRFLPPSITPLHVTFSTLSYCNWETLLWHALWPSWRPVPVSAAVQRTGLALTDGGQLEMRTYRGQDDRDMKDTTCWETPAGNYADEVRTREGFDLCRRKWEGLDRHGRARGTKIASQYEPLILKEILKNHLNNRQRSFLNPKCWSFPNLCYRQGRLKLTVLSEDRLQMKWKEADGPVQGYKVRVRTMSGENIFQALLNWWKL